MISDESAQLWRDTIQDHLHRAMVPVWLLTPGLRMRRDADGLTVLSNEGQDLVTIPWHELPPLDGGA